MGVASAERGWRGGRPAVAPSDGDTYMAISLGRRALHGGQHPDERESGVVGNHCQPRAAEPRGCCSSSQVTAWVHRGRADGLK